MNIYKPCLHASIKIELKSDIAHKIVIYNLPSYSNKLQLEGMVRVYNPNQQTLLSLTKSYLNHMTKSLAKTTSECSRLHCNFANMANYNIHFVSRFNFTPVDSFST